MVTTRLSLLLASIMLLFPGIAAIDDAQVVLSHDDPLASGSVDELSDLLQSSIWLEQNRTDPADVAFHCCNILNSTLPEQVFFPESTEYQAQQASYYSVAQSELHPTCRVSPASAIEVSVIVSLATRYDCAFAVRSGGHMISKGFSNVDATGFTIDLQAINHISVLNQSSIVSFGSGCRWHEVYGALKPHNLTTVGGRVPDVGVSGFLLGGGISALSLAHGFGSSNVLNYQVVFADGTINDVNEQTMPDLYWALKYGSTNYGIVTRFDMTTYPLTDIWGGTLIFDIGKGPALLQAHVEFTAKLTSDPLGLNIVGLSWDPTQQAYVVWSPNLYFSGVPFPPLYSDLQPFVPEALLNTMRVTDFISITEEWKAMAPGSGRAEWFTITVKTDAAVLWDIYQKGVELFQPSLNRTNFSWTMVFQPLNRGFAAAGEKNGGNPSGISSEDGDLTVVLGMTLWSDPADDAIIKDNMQQLWRWSQSTARDRGLLHPFIYMNYASNLQDVMGSVGAENHERMRDIKNKYDPENRFGKYWKGGFKL